MSNTTPQTNPADYVSNVQVEIMDAATDDGVRLDSQYAMAIMQRAGVPIRSMPVVATFDGSYLVDVDAIWYTQLGDGGEYTTEVEYAGYWVFVSLARP